jgi:hypothetical protein
MLAGTAFVFGLPVSLLMFALGIALARFERFQARNDERFLIKFLIKTLDAREVP